MLFGRLKALYEKNEVLKQKFPLDEYYPLLRKFISQEVALGATYLSPYRFALSFSLSVKDSIKFFLGLTDSENILNQYYKYQCDECGTINIIKDEEQLAYFVCKECGFEDHLTKKDYLNEVKILFRLNDEIVRETENYLKDNPLSREEGSINETLERGLDIETTILTMENSIYEDGVPISIEAEKKMKKIQRYRAIAEGVY